MDAFIRISLKWSDEDVHQLQFEVSDGVSTFVNSTYTSLDWPETLASDLQQFGRQIHGGLYDMRAGNSGPEFADGETVARFHWYRPSQLLISTRQETDFFEFKGSQVTSEARMFMRTEPALLDGFITELRGLRAQQCETATLECMSIHGV